MYFSPHVFWLPDVPKSMGVLVSLINDVYGINCQMLVSKQKGETAPLHPKVILLSIFKQKKQCVLQDICNYFNNIKIKVLWGPNLLCMMDEGDVLKIWFFVISYVTHILWHPKFMAASTKHLAWTSWDWWLGNACLLDSKIRIKLRKIRHRLWDSPTL